MSGLLDTPRILDEQRLYGRPQLYLTLQIETLEACGWSKMFFPLLSSQQTREIAVAVAVAVAVTVAVAVKRTEPPKLSKTCIYLPRFLVTWNFSQFSSICLILKFNERDSN